MKRIVFVCFEKGSKVEAKKEQVEGTSLEFFDYRIIVFELKGA